MNAAREKTEANVEHGVFQVRFGKLDSLEDAHIWFWKAKLEFAFVIF